MSEEATTYGKVKKSFHFNEMLEAAAKVLNAVGRMKQSDAPNDDAILFYSSVAAMLMQVSQQEEDHIELKRQVALYKDMYDAAWRKNELLEQALALYDPSNRLLSANVLADHQSYLRDFRKLVNSGELVPDGEPFFFMRWVVDQQKNTKN